MPGTDTPRRLESGNHAAAEDSRSPVIPVLVVTPVCLYRDGIVALLERDEGVTVVGTAAHVGEAVQLAARLDALVLFDAMTAESCAEIRAMRDALPEVSILALTVRRGEQQMLELAEAGVHGFVTVDASLAELGEAIRSAARGEAICSPSLAAAFMRRIAALSHDAQPRDAGPALTVREQEILALVEEGLSNKQIALQLRIQLSTAKNHVHSILGKLGVQRRAEVVALGRGRVRPTQT
jgi:two-component system nitrate/nitrite response regulator NarL